MNSKRIVKVHKIQESRWGGGRCGTAWSPGNGRYGRMYFPPLIFFQIHLVQPFAAAMWIHLQQISSGLSVVCFSFFFLSRNLIYMWAGLSSVPKFIVCSISAGAEQAQNKDWHPHSFSVIVYYLTCPQIFLFSPVLRSTWSTLSSSAQCQLPVDFIGCRSEPIKLKCGWRIQWNYLAKSICKQSFGL